MNKANPTYSLSGFTMIKIEKMKYLGTPDHPIENDKSIQRREKM
jgi:hypothetical protein